MAFIDHSEHIENLALQPIGRWPNARNRRNLFPGAHLHPQTQAVVPFEGVK